MIDRHTMAFIHDLILVPTWHCNMATAFASRVVLPLQRQAKWIIFSMMWSERGWIFVLNSRDVIYLTHARQKIPHFSGSISFLDIKGKTCLLFCQAPGQSLRSRSVSWSLPGASGKARKLHSCFGNTAEVDTMHTFQLQLSPCQAKPEKSQLDRVFISWLARSCAPAMGTMSTEKAVCSSFWVWLQSKRTCPSEASATFWLH